MNRDLLIEHLHKTQDSYGFISAAHVVALAHEIKLSAVEVYEVATFYHHFDVVKEGQTPPPALTVRVCDSVSCELTGAQPLLTSLQQGLGDNLHFWQRLVYLGNRRWNTIWKPCTGYVTLSIMVLTGLLHKVVMDAMVYAHSR